MLTLPFQVELDRARNVLLCGAGGGFDIFSGLPLYFALRGAGKRVHLANLTFADVPPDAGRRPVRELVEVTAAAGGSSRYFPEKFLSEWFERERGERVPVWCVERVGPAGIGRAYAALNEELRPDTVIVVDGGTDALMRGDEWGLGSPVEDIGTVAAVDALGGVERKMLVALGFGVDAYHEVSHVDVLAAIAELAQAGGYLGALSLVNDAPEAALFRRATEYVLERTPDRLSIVCTSVLAALAGHFGDCHATDRTAGSELFINPLMAVYWAFRLEAVARRVMYLERFRHLEGRVAAEHAINEFRRGLPAIRERRAMPL